MFWYHKVEQGKALVVSSPNKVAVSFTGMFVPPAFRKIETMDISLRGIEIDRRGEEGLICRDNIRADIKVVFFVRVNKTEEDVVRVAQSIGCARASDPKTLEELFNAKFSEALKTVGKQLDFEDLYTKREEFRDQIIQVIGRDLNGYVLEDAAIDFLEQTPLQSLDARNILDAQGIRKITELTAAQMIKTNEFQNHEKKQIKKQDVEAAETILELERQHADAEARQQREIATVRAREQAETQKVSAEERLKSETARIRADEEIEVQDENRMRQVEVAQKNRERVVAVEAERVEKDRSLEAIAREREVELQRIAKEKQLEAERKEIADIIRERIAVEHTMAQEEERIKALRMVEEANRNKEATIIMAEAEAQQQLVKDIKAAEAAETAAGFKARERLVLAEANLEATDKEAQAKIRMAEGVRAEEAARGLAEVAVKEADAAAIEKVGLAEARVTLERMQAEARGTELRGDAEAKVKERDAAATEMHGKAEAVVLREKGVAEAEAVKERLAAEASGLAEKAEAMKALDEAGRGHEEFRLQLEVQRALQERAIEARREIASVQADALGKALAAADIDIVGGSDVFVDRIMNAVSMGKAADGLLDGSRAAQAVLGDYVNGDRSLAVDLKDVLTRPRLGSGDLQSLTLSALLAKLVAGSDADRREKLDALRAAVEDLGLGELEL